METGAGLSWKKKKIARRNRTPGWEILTPRDIGLGSVRLGVPGKGGQARREGSRERWNTRDSEVKIGASTGAGPIQKDRRENENPRGETRSWNVRIVGDPKIRKDSGVARRNVALEIVSCEKGRRPNT